MGPTEPRNGRTIVQALLEELWKELDTIVEHIMAVDKPDPEDFWRGHDEFDDMRHQEACIKYGEWRGQAQGIAYALAVLRNPYQPDVEAIRTEAMERWEAGEGE